MSRWVCQKDQQNKQEKYGVKKIYAKRQRKFVEAKKTPKHK
jgi:hypothetical protein